MATIVQWSPLFFIFEFYKKEATVVAPCKSSQVRKSSSTLHGNTFGITANPREASSSNLACSILLCSIFWPFGNRPFFASMLVAQSSQSSRDLFLQGQDGFDILSPFLLNGITTPINI